jgi:hypothetical protein
MTEDSRFGGTPKRAYGPASEDYGFFTTPKESAPSHFGGPSGAPSQFGGPPPAPAPPAPRAAPAYLPPAAAAPAIPAQATPAAGNQFGPPPSPLAQPWQSGPPAAPGQPYPAVARRGLPAWAIVAICVPVGFIFLGILAAIAIPVFLNARSTPVMPESVHGVGRTSDPVLTQNMRNVRDGLLRKNPGSKIDVAGYGAMNSGYVVVGANLRLDATREFTSMGSSAAPMLFGEIQCGTNISSHISMCLRVGTRGSVEVMAIGGSDLSELAVETSKVWSAQPFGN